MRFRSAKHVRWYVGTALFFVALHFLGVLKPVERFVRSFMDPVLGTVYSGTQAIGMSGILSKDSYTATEYDGLARERDAIKTRIALVEAENATLRKELNFPERKNWNIVGAEVIAKTSDVSSQALIINRGTRDGLKPQQIVFTEHGVMVGEISVVEADRAFVRLINDRQSRIGALHAVSSRAVGIVEGGYGLGVRLTLIPPEEVVQTGDLVVTNDVSEFIPRGLLIGRVVSVGRETYEPFQHALIEPSVNYDHVKMVTVIIKK